MLTPPFPLAAQPLLDLLCRLLQQRRSFDCLISLSESDFNRSLPPPPDPNMRHSLLQQEA